MKLYLVQHGEAVAKEIDPERPLRERGRRDVERMAKFLQRGGVSVKRVLHSGKCRAEQTARLLAAALLPDGQPEPVEGIGPNGDVAAFARKLEDLRGDTLVAGHLPFMARLAAQLVTGNSEPGMLAYRPGSVACLDQGEDGKWLIEWMIRTELLGD